MSNQKQPNLSNEEFYMLCCKAILQRIKLPFIAKVKFYFSGVLLMHTQVLLGIIVYSIGNKELTINIFSAKEWLIVESMYLVLPFIAYYCLTRAYGNMNYTSDNIKISMDYIYNYARKKNLSINSNQIEQFKEIVRNCMIKHTSSCTYQDIADALCDERNPLQKAIKKDKEDEINREFNNA